MIQKIHIENFESHEDTLLDNLDAGFNLVAGISNSGKTSIVRALLLVGFNEFNPSSIRVGCKNCRIRVTTEKGTVDVTRGEGINKWVIQYANGTSEEFHNVGRNPVPQAQAVLGFRAIQLGDISVNLNISNQLDSHFLLAGIEGKDASGSMRAQVVDEISGLSGVEMLIKNVSLDNLRISKDTRRLSEEVTDLALKIHNPDVLDCELGILDNAQQEIGLEALKKTASETLRNEAALFESEAKAISICETKLSEIPDTTDVTTHIQNAESNTKSSNEIRQTYEIWESNNRKIQSAKQQLADFPSVVVIDPLVSLAFTNKERARKIKDSITEYNKEQDLIVKLSNRLSDSDVSWKEAQKELQSLLLDIKICPITLHPIKEDCMKGILDAPNPS